ncbi:HET-C-related protein [Candidatus Electrothrix sp.]|uniref:HET-C-related protein n=1 Tax=Candidatus Electrothrix sp. TaxID=2170559 RepID=UPI004055D9A6
MCLLCLLLRKKNERGLNGYDKPAVTPGAAEEIGAYYPLDHFDVTNQYIIQEGMRVLDDREELELKQHAEQGFMTTTALQALEYAKQDWLKKAFEATRDEDRAITCQNRIHDYQALKVLGHGLHTLQDFYAHSNYSELLLICMAEHNLLDHYWNQRIQHLVHNTAIGTFNAFVLCKESPDDLQGSGEITPVVTGRFDTIDTVHTLLHLAIENIHSHGNETNHNEKEKKDRIVRLLFGTFSEIDVVQKMQGSVEAYRTLANHIDVIQDKITDFFMDYLIDPFVKKTLHGQETLVNAYLLLKDATLNNDRTLQEYRKAGEMLFHQHTIEDHLRKIMTKAEQADKIILPHHALLAKDHDKDNDAVKLSYKLSCALAAEASTEVLVKYFQGAEFSELEPLLERRYVHPRFHREQCATTGSLNRTIQSLQGKKWFQHAVQNPENGQSILGFDTNALLNN